MRALDHVLDDPGAFLGEVVGACPAGSILQVSWGIWGDMARALEPHARADASWWRRLGPSKTRRYAIDERSRAELADCLRRRVSDLRAAFADLKLESEGTTWFECHHLEHGIAFLHDGFPPELASRLVAGGVMHLDPAERRSEPAPRAAEQ